MVHLRALFLPFLCVCGALLIPDILPLGKKKVAAADG